MESRNLTTAFIGFLRSLPFARNDALLRKEQGLDLLVEFVEKLFQRGAVEFAENIQRNQGYGSRAGFAACMFTPVFSFTYSCENPLATRSCFNFHATAEVNELFTLFGLLGFMVQR